LDSSNRESRALAFVLAAVALLAVTLPLLGFHSMAERHEGGIFKMESTSLPTRDAKPRPEAAPGWGLELTNKLNSADYPRTVRGGDPYSINVTLNATVPGGQIGSLSLSLLYLHVDPESFRRVVLENTSSIMLELPSGNTTVARSLMADTRIVNRDSFDLFEFGADLYNQNQSVWEASAYNSYELTVVSVNPAKDVYFRGTVEGVLAWLPFLLGLAVRVDEVLYDPTRSIVVNEMLVVYLDTHPQPGAIIPHEASVHDIVDVHGDHDPAEGPPPFVGVWKNVHSTLRIGTRNRAPTLIGPELQPNSGDERTTFVFSIRSADADGDNFDVFLVLDGEKILMDYVEGSNLTGAVYRQLKTLTPGVHTYRFLVDDRFGAPNSKNSTQIALLSVGSYALVVIASSSAIGGVAAGVAAYVLVKRRRDRGTTRAPTEEPQPESGISGEGPRRQE